MEIRFLSRDFQFGLQTLSYPKGLILGFTSETINLEKGDVIYMFSDGYVDQYGGPASKRFMIKRFKELLLANHELPLAKQRELLFSTLREWMVNGEQTDDILVLGIRF